MFLDEGSVKEECLWHNFYLLFDIKSSAIIFRILHALETVQPRRTYGFCQQNSLQASERVDFQKSLLSLHEKSSENGSDAAWKTMTSHHSPTGSDKGILFILHLCDVILSNSSAEMARRQPATSTKKT